MPVQKLRFRAGASQYKADSTVSFLQPQNSALGQSIYAEKGNGIEGGIGFFLTKFSIDADVARFDNERIIKIDRCRARVVYDFLAKVGLAAELSRDEYTEENSTLGDYDATRYGIFLRYRP